MLGTIRDLIRGWRSASDRSNRSVDESDHRRPPQRDSGYTPPPIRVDNVLASHGGMASQGEVRAATGWSPSKTSRVLSELETQQQIVRFRVGRENIVCLPGHEPAWATDQTEVDRRPER